MFETYENVIERRLERKREIIEVREREKIIDDYRRKYINVNSKYEKL